jgi:hypothetical protein
VIHDPSPPLNLIEDLGGISETEYISPTAPPIRNKLLIPPKKRLEVNYFSVTVKILDLHLSTTKFALRLSWAIILSGLTLFFFYYLPTHLASVISAFVPPQYFAQVNAVASNFEASPVLLYLGVLLSVLAFFDVMLKGFWGYGIVLIISGLFFLAYFYYLFKSGLFFVPIRPLNSNSPSSTLNGLTYALDSLAILFILSTILSIARGVLLISRRGFKKQMRQVDF